MPVPPRPRAWSAATLVVALAAGLLFVTSAISSHGVDLRASSVTDLTTLLINERERVNSLQAEVANVNQQVSALSQSIHDTRVDKLQPTLAALRIAAGFTPVAGQGVTVTLTDAPKSVIDRAQRTGSTLGIDALLVHQQDIQAVVNALWSGGAAGISVQGQRIITTTGIKCVGNTVVLHGVPYSPPYVITAVGNIKQLTHALDTSEYVAAYKTFVAPPYYLGWNLTTSQTVTVPAFVGTSDLNEASVDTAATKKATRKP
ncbi:MAG: DUF881 domain-containing protein [Marmoricola sp.]